MHTDSHFKKTLLSVAIVGLASVAIAQPVINGTLDSLYGSALSVQANSTGFGDANTTSVSAANGSELDAGYATISGGKLYIFLAGNLENNFNKLDIFIDSKSGGMNRLAQFPSDQGNFNRMAGDGITSGLRFDSAFTADHWISATTGGGSIFVDYGNLSALTGNYSGTTTPGSNGILTGGNGGATIELTLNNSNTTGVTGSTAPNDAAIVATGIELAISLSDLGYTSGDLRVSAFINGSGQDFLANQVLGPIPFGTGNLGEPRSVDFQNIAGEQYFTVAAVPEPATVALMILGGGALLFRRRSSVGKNS